MVTLSVQKVCVPSTGVCKEEVKLFLFVVKGPLNQEDSNSTIGLVCFLRRL